MEHMWTADDVKINYWLLSDDDDTISKKKEVIAAQKRMNISPSLCIMHRSTSPSRESNMMRTMETYPYKYSGACDILAAVSFNKLARSFGYCCDLKTRTEHFHHHGLDDVHSFQTACYRPTDQPH